MTTPENLSVQAMAGQRASPGSPPPKRPIDVCDMALDSSNKRLKASGPGPLSLLGLPTEIRLKILRLLLVSPEPLAVEKDRDPNLHERYSWDEGTDFERDLGDRYGRTTIRMRVPLATPILRANRQLYREGRPLVKENSISIRITGSAMDPFQPLYISDANVGRVEVTVFDHGRPFQLEQDSQTPYWVFDFRYLHLDVELDPDCLPHRVRAVMQQVVCWLNGYVSEVPKTLSLSYKHETRKQNWVCVICARGADGCKCELMVDREKRREATAVKVLTPLIHLDWNFSVKIAGVDADDAAELENSINVPPESKPKCLYIAFMALLAYFKKLPSDKLAWRVISDLQLAALSYPSVAGTGSEQILGSMGFVEEEWDDEGLFIHKLSLTNVFHCPQWIRMDTQLVRRAMWDNDTKSFLYLCDQVMERAKLVMQRYQPHQVLHADWEAETGEGRVFCESQEREYVRTHLLKIESLE